MRRALAVLTILALTAACARDAPDARQPSADGPPSPDSNVTTGHSEEDATPVVSGEWVGALTGLTDGVLTCDVVGTRVTISQSGRAFRGMYRGGRFSCSGAGGRREGEIGEGRIIDGVAAGDSVAFDLNSAGTHLSGAVHGASMSGAASLSAGLLLPGRQAVLRGSWSAIRR